MSAFKCAATTKAGVLAMVFLASTVAPLTHANPALDRAFGDCATAAAAYLAIRGDRIGAITVLVRDADKYRMRIVPEESNVEPAAIICTSSRESTAIEMVSMRQLAGD